MTVDQNQNRILGGDGGEAEVRQEPLGRTLYESFWARNGGNAPAWCDQASAIRNMWDAIADDARDALASSPVGLDREGVALKLLKKVAEKPVAFCRIDADTQDAILALKATPPAETGSPGMSPLANETQGEAS